MKSFFTLALLAVTAIASAQPGHHRGNGKGHKKHDKYNKHYNRDHDDRRDRDYRRDDYKRGRYVDNRYNRDYDYRVEREISRYDFLSLSRNQRQRLQVSLNFLVSNNYAQREYERRLRSDLYNILSRDQYNNWERRAYTGGNSNTFVFNFGR